MRKSIAPIIARIATQTRRYLPNAVTRLKSTFLLLLSTTLLGAVSSTAYCDSRSYYVALMPGLGTDRTVAANGTEGNFSIVFPGDHAPAKEYILQLFAYDHCRNSSDIVPRQANTTCEVMGYDTATIPGWHEAGIHSVEDATAYLNALEDATFNCGGGGCQYFSPSSTLPAMVAVTVDEPYLGVIDKMRPDDHSWRTTPCIAEPTTQILPPTSEQLALIQIKQELQFLAQAVHKARPKTRFWVNFSEPEIQWMLNGNCNNNSRTSFNPNLNSSLFDIVSMDKYDTPFSPVSPTGCPTVTTQSFSSVEPYYSCLLTNNKLFSGQQLGLVPCSYVHMTYTGCTPNSLAQYYNFAQASNQSCNKSFGATGTTGRNDGCPVWIVAGWNSDFWTTVPTSNPIKAAWHAQAANVNFTTSTASNPPGVPDSTSGFVESVSVASGPHQGGDIVISGWALDNFALGVPTYIDVWETNDQNSRQYVGETMADGWRSDVSTYYRSGFTIKISIWQYLTPGCHTFTAYSIAPGAESWNYRVLPAATGVSTKVCL